MNKLTVCLFLAFLHLQNISQGQAPGQLVIGNGDVKVTFLEKNPDLNSLYNFMHRGLSNTGVAYSTNSSPNFLIFCTISYAYEKQLEVNGIPIIAAELEFYFDLRDKKGNTSFGQYSSTIKESGENYTVLLRNATRQLNSKNKEFQAFIDRSKENILTYYMQHCDEIIAVAERDLILENFDASILALGQVPVEVPCFAKANELMQKVYIAKLEKQCTIMVQKARTLSQKGELSEAYDLAMSMPSNSQCADDVKVVLDDIANTVCEKYISQAETHFAKNDLDKCADALASVELFSSDCRARKLAVESKMKSQLNAETRKAWELKMTQYRDAQAARQTKLNHELSLENKKTDHEIAMDNRRMNLEVQKERTQANQAKLDHNYSMAKLDSDAKLRAKELDIAPEMAKIEARRAIAQSNNQRVVDVARANGAAKVYSSMFTAMAASTRS